MISTNERKETEKRRKERADADNRFLWWRSASNDRNGIAPKETKNNFA